MSGLFFANTLIARAPGTIDQALLLGGIFLIEPLVLWCFFNKVSKIKINFPGLMLVSLLANLYSSLLGVLLGGLTVFNTSMGPYIPFILYIRPLNTSGLVYNLILLGFAFGISVLLEWSVYRDFPKLGKRMRSNSLKAAALANLGSYILLFLYIIYISVWVPEESVLFPQLIRHGFDGVFKAQQAFYLQRSRFGSLEELDIEDSARAEYQIGVADKEKATMMIIREHDTRSISRGLRNYIGAVFVLDGDNQDKPEFIAAICRSDRVSMTAPEIPKLVNGEILCPPGYSRFDRYQQQEKK